MENAPPETAADDGALEGTKQPADSLRKDARKADTKTSAGGGSSAIKKTCKKHARTQAGKKKAKRSSKKMKKEEENETSTESESSESSSEDSSDAEKESDSDSDSSDSCRKKQKQSTKKAKSRRLREKAKKCRSGKKRSAVDEETSSSEDESEDERLSRKNAKAKSKAKKLAKKKATEEEESEETELGDTPESVKLRAMKAQLALLGIDPSRATQSGRMRRAVISKPRLELDDTGNRTRARKAERAKAKKKRASKVAFKRVDQLWDQSIHNYKLTETIDDPDADEFDQYIFTVRRKFDWEHKYQETLVDIRSKHLKEALRHIMADVKGVSLVQETPHIDPNMLFLYLEETRAYMNELKMASKTDKKRKTRKAAATKAAHLKILVKYLDNDYAETKKTLYPLLENRMITFDLLWALFKPNT